MPRSALHTLPLVSILLLFGIAVQSAQAQSTATPQPTYKNFLGVQFVEIPPGTFVMGSCQHYPINQKNQHPQSDTLITAITGCAPNHLPDSDAGVYEAPQHEVTIKRGFQMAIHEVTIGQYMRFLQENRHLNTEDFLRTNSVYGQKANYPVLHVGHRDAIAFAEWMNRRKPNSDRGIYRLPSETEWEYATRAGSTSRYWWGSTITCNKADYGDSRCNKTGPSPVGSYEPNPFGLYDVHGNVAEWVADCWHNNYIGIPNDGSVWTSENCPLYVYRGGSWSLYPEFLRSADRKVGMQDFRYIITGFRMVRELP
ncbi:MAG: formylglycine-generating enzyme family protein [Alphaproteobacteria bacterium]|nr:formylglycine-generating enzyme family protein [Alphaproteobacteria bacterium]